MGRWLESGTAELPADLRATVEAQHRILTDAQRGSNDKTLVKRALEVLRWAAGAAGLIAGGVVSNLAADQIPRLINAALDLF